MNFIDLEDYRTTLNVFQVIICLKIFLQKNNTITGK